MKTNSTDKINKRIEAIRAKREELKAISQPFRALVKEGAMDTINEGIRGIYAEQGHTTLKTLKQWNKEGFQVKKGEHAFLLWGSPVSRSQKDENKEGEDSESDFFPVCFVFSQNQVQQR
ncbi:MAG: ArdC-like ssDNA-binding domain-containing protein [Paludibacter sp.]|nr:ArdC-like ssDNA-binding domain-containing protein [Paludibacter sp.]